MGNAAPSAAHPPPPARAFEGPCPLSGKLPGRSPEARSEAAGAVEQARRTAIVPTRGRAHPTGTAYGARRCRRVNVECAHHRKVTFFVVALLGQQFLEVTSECQCAKDHVCRTLDNSILFHDGIFLGGRFPGLSPPACCCVGAAALPAIACIRFQNRPQPFAHISGNLFSALLCVDVACRWLASPLCHASPQVRGVLS